MPRQTAPPPSGEFTVTLTTPFSGTPTHTVEVIGEPNRPASVRTRDQNTDKPTETLEKKGDMSADDVNELMTLISTLRGFPSHPTKDVYGQDAKVEFNTFELQWSNAEEDPAANEISEIAAEQQDDFKRIVQSINALGRQFATAPSAV